MNGIYMFACVCVLCVCALFLFRACRRLPLSTILLSLVIVFINYIDIVIKVNKLNLCLFKKNGFMCLRV